MLAAAADPVAVARLSVQAALRAVGADSAAFVLRSPDGLGHLLHGEGYTEGFLSRYATVTLTGEQAVSATLREGAAVWLDRSQMLAHPDPAMRKAAARTAAFACFPAASGQDVLAALVVSWNRDVPLEQVLRAHLLVMGEAIGARLAALPAS